MPTVYTSSGKTTAMPRIGQPGMQGAATVPTIGQIWPRGSQGAR